MTRIPKEYLTRYPVSSFGPELMDILIRGARERIEIAFPDGRTMAHFQARIHALRASMRRENHSQYALATRARTSRSWKRGEPNTDCVLIVQPNDAQFTSILRAAGIKASEHTKDLLDDVNDQPAKPEPIDPIDPYAKFKGE